MKIDNYITALENIDNMIWQVIGALKGEKVKKIKVNNQVLTRTLTTV